MIIEDSVHKAVCDGCERIQYHEVVDDVIGYAGTVMHSTDYGGTGGDWFACSKRCVSRAVLSVCEPKPHGVPA